MNRFHPTPLVAALAMAGLAQAGAPTSTPTSTQLPTGGSVVAGTASIASAVGTNSASMTITQSSQRAVVDWTRFDVGSSAQVAFVQPSASSVTLNRVLSSDPSQIFGRISANGQVFLTNSSGVYFAPGSSVDVGGLVATTHSIGNDAFMAGSNSFSRNGSTGTVQNDGTLNAALGGYIALLAPTVRNQGVVVAKLGTVAMAAGETFTLHIDGANALTGLEVTASTVASLVDNGLAVQAPGGLIILSAQALDRVQGGVVNNSGVLQANGLVNDGGRIMLRASSTISHSGSITADAVGTGKGGTVTLVADLANTASRTEVNGSISAKGGEAGGDGGFIETSASKVRFGDNMAISTLAAPGLGGRNGTWLIDPTDFTIASSGGDMTGTALGTSLASSNVTIYSSSGSSGSDGAINVNQAVSWSANTLTLNAQANINVNAAMTGSGTAKLAFQYGQSAVSSGNSSTYNISAAVSLPSGSNFSTQLGTDGTVKSYTVITSLGSAGDESLASATNSLQGLAYSTRLSGNYVLGADIAASGTSTWNSNSGFSPIGNDTTAFSGKLEGLGHTITGLTISRSSTENALFGKTSSAATISNLGMLSASINGLGYSAALVGVNAAAISNAYATGSVTGTTQSGGLVGYNNAATIASSYSSVSVSGGSGNYLGGLVGTNDGTISSSYATGSVSGTGSYAGGLLGYSSRGAIKSSYATGSVSGGSYTGGLIGASDTAVTVTSSYATGSVRGFSGSVGGLIGANNGTISSSYATGSVSASGGVVGGLIGSNPNGTITSSYATGSVTGSSYAGGLVGDLGSTVTVSSSYATGSVTGSGGNFGGLIGQLKGSVTSSYATGSVSAAGSGIGGLAGYLTSTGTLSGSYSTGSVSGASNVGGLVGTGSGTITTSYFDKTTSGKTYGVGSNTSATGVTGLTTANMQAYSSFSSTWSIASSGGSSSTWRIYDGYTYPLLRTFLTSLATDTSTTYTGSVQYGIGNGLSNITGTIGSGTNAGTYTSGTLYSNQKGYDLSGSGTLTIAKAPLTITGSSASSTYTGVAQTLSGYTVSGLVGSDTTSSLSGVSASVSGTNAGSYTNSVTASTQTNYSVTTADGTLTISVPTSSSVGSSTTVVDPELKTFRMPEHGLSGVLFEDEGAHASTY